MRTYFSVNVHLVSCILRNAIILEEAEDPEALAMAAIWLFLVLVLQNVQGHVAQCLTQTQDS